MHSTCGDHPDGVFWTKSCQFGPSDDHFRGQKTRFGTIWGLKTACLLVKWRFKVQKWVSDTYLVNIGQLDHYVLFGTKFGAVQDFERGKKCPIGVQETPPRLPQTTQTPTKPPQTPSVTLLKTNFIPLVIL